MRHLLAIDVGGTFTDFVAHDGRGGVAVWKELSVPADPVEGILNGLAAYPAAATVENIRLGTTVATNAVLERKGAVVAYVTTRGFRDVPLIQRGNRRAHYDMSWVQPKPLVKRRHCFELAEWIDAYGEVVTALDPAEVRAVAAAIRAVPEIQAVAVCRLFSYLNPAHERAVKAIFGQELPGMPPDQARGDHPARCPCHTDVLMAGIPARARRFWCQTTTVPDDTVHPRIAALVMTV